MDLFPSPEELHRHFQIVTSIHPPLPLAGGLPRPTSTERYRRVPLRPPSSPPAANEIRINSRTDVTNCYRYASDVIRRGHTEVVFKAIGRAIQRAILVVELVKETYPLLHQDTAISLVSFIDLWMPVRLPPEVINPIDVLPMARILPTITITLSTTELNENSPGNQVPQGIAQPTHQQMNPQQQLLQPEQIQRQLDEDSNSQMDRGGSRAGGRQYAVYVSRYVSPVAYLPYNNLAIYGGYNPIQGAYGGYGHGIAGWTCSRGLCRGHSSDRGIYYDGGNQEHPEVNGIGWLGERLWPRRPRGRQNRLVGERL